MSDYEFDISTSKTREQLAELYRAKSRQVGRLSDENERLRAALKKIEAAWQDEVMDGQSSPLLDVIEAALREMSVSERHLTPEEQETMHRALRRSAKIVSSPNEQSEDT